MHKTDVFCYLLHPIEVKCVSGISNTDTFKISFCDSFTVIWLFEIKSDKNHWLIISLISPMRFSLISHGKSQRCNSISFSAQCRCGMFSDVYSGTKWVKGIWVENPCCLESHHWKADFNWDCSRVTGPVCALIRLKQHHFY